MRGRKVIGFSSVHGIYQRQWKEREKIIVPSVEPFISKRNIEKGTVGLEELSDILEKTNFGIICLTKECLHEDWILFEAGALSEFQKESRVWTFLLDLKSENINGPLAKFQHTNF